MIILLIVLDAYTCYVTDLGRVLLQSLRKMLVLGIYTTAWMFLRFALCIAGIFLFHTVWAALAGIVLSTVLAFVAFYAWILRTTSGRSDPGPVTLRLRSLLPAATGYGLMALVSNLDVLLGYFVLGKHRTGHLLGLIGVSQGGFGCDHAFAADAHTGTGSESTRGSVHSLPSPRASAASSWRLRRRVQSWSGCWRMSSAAAVSALSYALHRYWKSCSFR